MISRPLWATYVVTPEQKSSGILISELFEVRKWVVEKFHGISPGLLGIPCPKVQSTLGFATMGKAANLGLATRNAVTDLF